MKFSTVSITHGKSGIVKGIFYCIDTNEVIHLWFSGKNVVKYAKEVRLFGTSLSEEEKEQFAMPVKALEIYQECLEDPDDNSDLPF